MVNPIVVSNGNMVYANSSKKPTKRKRKRDRNPQVYIVDGHRFVVGERNITKRQRRTQRRHTR
jgi:hypothetical protein